MSQQQQQKQKQQQNTTSTSTSVGADSIATLRKNSMQTSSMDYKSIPSACTDDTDFQFDHENDYGYDYDGDDDPLGMHITALLNAGAFESIIASKYGPGLVPANSNSNTCKGQAEYDGTNNENSSIFPIFSLANAKWVHGIFSRSCQIIGNHYAKIYANNNNSNNCNINININSKSQIKNNNYCNTIPIGLPNPTQCLKSLFTFLVLSSVVISTCTRFVLYYAILFYVASALFVTSILIDVKDLYVICCPTFVRGIIGRLVKYVDWIGVQYLCTRRFVGRDQWSWNMTMSSKKESGTLGQSKINDTNSNIIINNNNSKSGMIHQHYCQFQPLSQRSVPFAILQDCRRKITSNTLNGHHHHHHHQKQNINGTIAPPLPTSSGTNSSSSAVWQCQNIHWDEMYSRLEKHFQGSENIDFDVDENNGDDNDDDDNNDDRHKIKSVLHKSTMDHLVATNFCYIMVHGKSKKSSLSRLKSKKKGQNIHRKGSSRNQHKIGYGKGPRDVNVNVNVNMRTPLSPILSARSEDVCETFDQMNGLNSVQSMDAIEVIRPKSTQRRDLLFEKVQSSPSIQRWSKKRVKKGELMENTGQPPSSLQAMMVRTMGASDDDYDIIDEGNAVGSGNDKSANMNIASNDHENITGSNPHHNYRTLLEDNDLTFNSSDEYSQVDLSFSDADVSFSSTSYIDESRLRGESNGDVEDEGQKKKDDMKWLDVGAKIGMRILESEKLHQAITKSQMASNVSSSYSTDDDNASQQRENLDFANVESPKGVAKPFHAMWTSPNVDNPSFDDDVASEDCYSYSEAGETADIDELLEKPPKIARRSTVTSLSPTSKLKKGRHGSTKSLRCQGRSVSLPTSPIRSRSVSSAKRSLPDANASFSSSEAFHQLVPKQFDANRYLPPSMAIHHKKVAEDVKPEAKVERTTIQNKKITDLTIDTNLFVEFSKKFHKESTRVKGRRRNPLLPGVRMIIPIFPASCMKKHRITQNQCYYQFATVTSSKRVNAASTTGEEEKSDCLSITALLDKSFLRSGKFAELTLRIHDTQRHMPR